MSELSAVYVPMIPMGWIGDEPGDGRSGFDVGRPVPHDWRDVVVDRQLACGIKVTAERRGFTVYDFHGWPPGMARGGGRSAGGLRTLGDVSAASKPALIQRLRIINTHLTLMHAAAMSEADESPHVVRVGERDLFRADVDETTGDDLWYQPAGAAISDVVTSVDSHRFGTMPAARFETTLDWLDLVVAARQLIEFDLLNQTQTAVSAHDYPLAVVAGWTVCELRVRAIGAAAGITAYSASDVTKRLKKAGHLTSTLSAKLDSVRQGRNQWLHRGGEPSEADAIEAMEAAAAMLTATIPALVLRPTSRLLIL